jgi:20S proteasome alpha/beta subunit
MTVGIAVISREGAIIGAADRAITWGNLLVEPRRSKIMHFNNCPISILWAGSLSTASEVVTTLGALAGQRRPEEITVEGVAHTAAACIARVFGTVAETRFLVPLEHTRASLLRDDCPVSEPERQRLLDQVQNFEPGDAESLQLLFAGYDPDGFPHLYCVHNLQVSDHTMDGYAAIGSGAWLAKETMHRHGYARQQTGHWRALLLAYLAKVEAEDDLYVGPKSNLFGREHITQKYVKIPSRLIRSLHRSYRKLKRDELTAFKKIADDIPGDFKQLMPLLAEAVAKRRRGTKREP